MRLRVCGVVVVLLYGRTVFDVGGGGWTELEVSGRPGCRWQVWRERGLGVGVWR